MSADTWNHEFFQVVKSEHEELTEILDEVRSALAAVDRTKNRVEDLITRLSDVVETHFRHEEHGGYLKDALERAPRLSAQADVLLDQHDGLLEEVEKLRLLVHSGVESPTWWTKIEADFLEFAKRLLDHEHAENKVLQEAFTSDIGSGD